MSILSTDVKSRAENLAAKKEDFAEPNVKLLIEKLVAIEGTPYKSGFLALNPDLTLYAKLKELADKLKNIADYLSKPVKGKPNQKALTTHNNRVTFVTQNIGEIEQLFNDFEYSVFRAYRSYLLSKYVSDVLTLGTKHAEIVNLRTSNDIFIKADTYSTFLGRRDAIQQIIDAYEELRKGKVEILASSGEFFTKGARLESLCLTATDPLKQSIDTHYGKVQQFYTKLALAKTAKPPPKDSKFLYPGQLYCLLENQQATIGNPTTFTSNQTNGACGEYSLRYVITNTKFVVHGHYRANGKKLCNLHIKHIDHEYDLNFSTWIEDYYYNQLIVIAPILRVAVT